MSCCGSKKTIPEQRVPPTVPLTQSQGQVYAPVTTSGKAPIAKIQFGAQDFNQTPLANPNSYVLTSKVDRYAQGVEDRKEDYSQEYNTVNKSNLFEKTDMLK